MMEELAGKTSKTSKDSAGAKLFRHSSSFSKGHMLVVVGAFALIGGYVLYRSFAAVPLVASMEAEQMMLPSGGSVINDSLASSGKAIRLSTNGTATGTVNFPNPVTSLTVVARGAQCVGAPFMTVSLDGQALLTNQSVYATSWTSYIKTPANPITAGSHRLSIAFTNDYSALTRKNGRLTYCSRDLYLDITNFYGQTAAPTPPPTVSLSVSPSSVAAGTSSTLTWNSTNATACTAAGAWSGTQPTAGSTSTGALNQNSTYTLSCTGAGGTSSASAAVTVTAVAPPGSGSGVIAPTAPSTYSIPAGAVRVTSSAELNASLASSGQHDIVLADGTYDNAGPFSNPNSDRLYSETLNAAKLTAGIVLGGNFGAGSPVVQGISFNITDKTKAPNGIVYTWGNSGANAKVYDCTFYGNKVADVGLNAYNSAGLDAQRLQFFDFTDEGIRASDNIPVSYKGSTPHIKNISDIYVNGVTYATPGASNGTAEAGVWIGHPVDGGVHRIKVRNVAISGIELVNNSWDTTLSDLDIDETGMIVGIAIYLEHYAYYDVITNFAIVGTNTGINSEWDYGTAGNAGGHFNTIKNGTIDATGAKNARTAGIFLDQGTESTTVSGVTFKNQSWAGIGAYKNTGTNTYTNNTYQLKAGAVQISTDHI